MMSDDDQFEWWLDDSLLPDVIWALARVLSDGLADVLEEDGRKRHFGSRVEASNALAEDEYVRPQSVSANDLARFGMAPEDLFPPTARTDSALLPLMRRTVAGADTIRQLAAVNWLEPWAILHPTERGDVERELRREIGRGHILHGRNARALLRRVDRDDVLFVLNVPVQLAVVHLTFTAMSPERPPWPTTETYDQVWKFVDRTHRDAAEYEAG